jgi:hypothetical protein
MPSPAEIDQLARELYEPMHLCPHPPCLAEFSWADRLRGRCPRCGLPLRAGPDFSPEQGRAMLTTLQTRRQALGLDR